MPRATLLDLPVEILQLVGEHLDARGHSSFSKSCKNLRAAACSSLFRNINLCFVDIAKLNRDLDRWSKVLDSYACWKVVRQLQIHAEFDMPPLLGISDLGDDPLEPWKYADDTPPEWTREHDQDFSKLAGFLDRLPALADLVWACPNQLPPCILSVLEEKNTTYQLRLHLQSFRMRSLLVPPAAIIRVDLHEKRLATSAVLYSLASRYATYDTDGNSDFNLEAIMAISTLAPNLKELFLCRELPGSSPALLAAMKVAPQEWRGDEIGYQEYIKQATLTKLVLSGASDLGALRTWNEKTDFGKIHTLKLYYDVPTEILGWLTELRPFSKALEEIGLTFSSRTIADASDTIERFFDSIPPLRRLRLSCDDMHSVLEVIFRRHGDSLYSLLLGKTLHNTRTLSNIQARCPNLRELALSITRSAGSEQETACYRIIGALQHLRHLHLTLNVYKRITTSDEASVIRTALIDSAVDESLAAAIFRTISASSPSKHDSLATLRLLVKIDHRSLGYTIAPACQKLARSWRCEKNPRDDALRHSCIVSELGVEEREDNESSARGLSLAPTIKTVILDLWPEQTTGDWRHDWHSWPLQDTEAT